MTEPSGKSNAPPSAPRLRFAPSPTGRLHLGHAYSALLNARLAADLGGTFLLRIEDLDPQRSSPERIAGIVRDLAWLGLFWPEPVRRQSDHLDAYRAAGERLRRAGLLYPCFCTRGEIAAATRLREEATGRPAPRDPDGTPLYPGTCRALSEAEMRERLAAGRPHAFRLDMAKALAGRPGPVWTAFEPAGTIREVRSDPARWGDVVLLRKDVPASYHLAVVHDDALQGITHVVRGRDLEAATDIHALLADLLGLPRPLYHHHRLLTDAEGDKLAKSRGSVSLAEMREAGIAAGEIRRMLGF